MMMPMMLASTRQRRRDSLCWSACWERRKFDAAASASERARLCDLVREKRIRLMTIPLKRIDGASFDSDLESNWGSVANDKFHVRPAMFMADSVVKRGLASPTRPPS